MTKRQWLAFALSVALGAFLGAVWAEQTTCDGVDFDSCWMIAGVGFPWSGLPWLGLGALIGGVLFIIAHLMRR